MSPREVKINIKKPGGSVPYSSKSSKLKKKDVSKMKLNSKPYGVKPEPFPRVLYTRAKFSDNITMTTSALGVCDSRPYRMGSIYDPRYSLGGNTVVGWSQLNAIYYRYWVMGIKVNVSFNNPTADGMRVGVLIRDGENGVGASGATLQRLSEMPRCYISGINNTGEQSKTFKFWLRPWQLVGVSKLEYLANSSKYASLMNNNPSTHCYIDIFAVNDDASLPSANVSMVCKFTYYVKCYDRNQLISTGV